MTAKAAQIVSTPRTTVELMHSTHPAPICHNPAHPKPTGKFPGKEGAALLVKMVFKTARECQPSVILIDECEKVRLTSVRRCT